MTSKAAAALAEIGYERNRRHEISDKSSEGKRRQADAGMTRPIESLLKKCTVLAPQAPTSWRPHRCAVRTLDRTPGA